MKNSRRNEKAQHVRTQRNVDEMSIHKRDNLRQRIINTFYAKRGTIPTEEQIDAIVMKRKFAMEHGKVRNTSREGTDVYQDRRVVNNRHEKYNVKHASHEGTDVYQDKRVANNRHEKI